MNKRIEDNLYELYMEMAGTGHCPIDIAAPFHAVGGAGLVWPDMVVMREGATGDVPVMLDASAVLDVLVGGIAAREWPRTVIFSAEQLTVEMQAALKAKGFMPVAQWTNMSINVSTGAGASSGVEVVKVDHERSLNEWLDVAGRVLFGGKGLSGLLFRQGMTNRVLHLFTAYIDGVAAATAMLFAGSEAGVYMVATLPEYRRRGISRVLMARVQAAAAEMGYKEVVLHATRDGLPFYLATGYEGFAKMTLYYYKNK